jgi:predicted nuclease with TOPRIM domain
VVRSALSDGPAAPDCLSIQCRPGLAEETRVFEALKEKSRLSAELETAEETISSQQQEIAKLREAVRVRSECIKELCTCLTEAAPWIDPIMIGPVTHTGEAARNKLLERINAALIWAGHRPPAPVA